MNQSFFSGSLDIANIPKQKLLRIYKQGTTSPIAINSSGGEVPLILDEDSVSIKAKSNFNNIGNPKSNTLMSLLSNLTDGAVPSGQFALQNAQVWESTEPLELEFEVNLFMKNNGYNDVVYPIKTLMKTCLPIIKSSGAGRLIGALVPPGPSIIQLLNLSSVTQTSSNLTENDYLNEGQLYEFDVLNFEFDNCIITTVTPSFSTVVDDNGNPVSAKVGITAKTCMVATKGMVETILASR